jgi:hypothetical protein
VQEARKQYAPVTSFEKLDAPPTRRDSRADLRSDDDTFLPFSEFDGLSGWSIEVRWAIAAIPRRSLPLGDTRGPPALEHGISVTRRSV